MLVLGTAAYAVCGLFLNGFGGIGILINADEKYHPIGVMLIASAGVFLGALVFAYIRRAWANILSGVLDATATVLYILPLNALNSIPDSTIPKANIDLLTSRIYPSIAVTVFLAAAVIADALTYDRITAREKRREERLREKNRGLNEDEKIV